MNNLNWVIIFMVASAVWGIIQSAVQNAEKKKREQKLREQASSPRPANQAPSSASSVQMQATPPAGRRTFPSAAPAASPGTTRSQQLADRRQAQLEQLRLRRQQRLQTGAAPRLKPAPIAPPSFPSPQQPARAARHPVQDLAASHKALDISRKREAKRKKHPHSPRELREQAAYERIGKRRPPSIPAAPEKRALSAVQSKLHAEKLALVPAVVQAVAPLRASSLRREINTPAALRRAFILKELIDPPLALRSGHLGSAEA